MIKEKYLAECFGKVNLSLHITGVSNGLHELDGIMATIDMKDTLTYYPGPNKLEIDIIDNVGNIDKIKYICVLNKTIEKLENRYEKLTGKMVLEKGVPLGAGLGGSTASLVCIIKIFYEYFKDLGKSARLDARFLCDIGSDVPFMYNGGIKRVSGVGDILEDVDMSNVDFPLYALIIYASQGVDTKDCYKLYDKINGSEYRERKFQNFKEVLENPSNDLFIPAKMLNKEIESNISVLETLGFKNIGMTGSGSALYLISNSLEKLQEMGISIQKFTKLQFKIVNILK